MRFWDSSAIVALLVIEDTTETRKALLLSDPVMTVWWASRLECASALNRLRREGALDEAGLMDAARAVDHGRLLVRSAAGGAGARQGPEALRIHPLRAADSLQLAAALIAVGEDTSGFTFVSNDERLREAAEKEGFIAE